jgi:sphinganine-1-phosphate aldolase
VVGNVTEPAGFHHMLNLTHEPIVGQYLADLADAMREAPAKSGAKVDATY